MKYKKPRKTFQFKNFTSSLLACIGLHFWQFEGNCQIVNPSIWKKKKKNRFILHSYLGVFSKNHWLWPLGRKLSYPSILATLLNHVYLNREAQRMPINLWNHHMFVIFIKLYKWKHILLISSHKNWKLANSLISNTWGKWFNKKCDRKN